MQWNEGQERAINTCWLDEDKTSRCNVLVNAAAGSGKTAVLVERIIRKLLPDEKGFFEDADRLLVVTFTKAAAAEMKQRINDRISQAMDDARGDKTLRRHLKRQQRLLGGADISNIDSFCMRMLRSHFHIAGVDPAVAPATDAQAKLLREQGVEEMFDDLYESVGEEAQRFCEFAEKYSGNYSDKLLSDIISSIYKFVMSLPEPEEWLDEQCAVFGAGEIEESEWVEILRGETETDEDTLSAAIAGMRAVLIHIIRAAFFVTFAEAQDLFDGVMENDETASRYWGGAWKAARADYESLCRLRDGEDGIFKWARFPTEAGKIKDIALKDGDKPIDDFDNVFLRVRHMRDSVKKAYSENQPYKIDLDAERVKITALREDMDMLCALTKRYIRKMDDIKAERNVLEFSDIERSVYRMLRDNPDVRDVYRRKYREILIDEYQDINALQEAIFCEISDGTNMFMVGDMKQSIYRFRSSDPTIFKHKLDTFCDERNRVITLNRNYRSRKQTLESINEVFEAVMSERVGEIIYDENQKLYAGDLSYEEINENISGANRAEAYVVTLPADGEESVSAVQAEAEFIADKIEELKRSHFKVRCKSLDGGFEYRDVQNRDIAILRRSVKNAADIYENALHAKQIDCYVEATGYFNRPEIKIMLSLIKAIDNPLCDIPLIALMRSYIFGFSDAELAQMRSLSQGEFYGCVTAAAESGDEKCGYFLECLTRWRGYAKYMPSDKLIWTLYEETDFYALTGTWDDGQAQANLRLLFERAKEYENTGFRGLFHFIRYIDKISEKEGDDLSPAKLISEEHDVVRIMTMHKSKGLEFPVVFLAGMCGQFKGADGNIALHRSSGIGLSYINEDRCLCSNITYDAVKKKNMEEELSESMRVLYVAMTRAKEKLYVVGAPRSGAMGLEAQWDMMYPGGAANARDSAKAKCFMDWVAPIARRSGRWLYHCVEYNPAKISAAQDIINLENETITEPDAILSYTYPYKAYTHMPPKVTVTQIKRTQAENWNGEADLVTFSDKIYRDDPVKRPRFLSERRLTGAEIGTAAHYVMQTLDDRAENMGAEFIQGHIERLCEKGRLSREAADSVRADKIAAFYETELGKRARKSMRVFKEQPFEILARAGEIFEGAPEEEKIIVQGIIDCYFIDDDGNIVLLDYKTDAYEKTPEGIERIRKKYEIQLKWYARAIEEITKKTVKEKYLYLFSGNDVVQC